MAGFIFRVWGTRFFVTMLLLIGAYRFAGASVPCLRTVAASFVSGLYGVTILFWGSMAGYQWISDLIHLGGITLLAFPWDKQWIRCTTVYFCMAGIASLVVAAIKYDSPFFLILAAGGFFVLSLFSEAKGNRGGKILYVEHGGRNHPLIGMIDTGNCLMDPVTGESVLVMSGKKSGELVGLGKEQLEDPVKTICSMKNKGLCLVPYNSVGCSGLLLAKRFSEVQIDGVKQSRLIAFAPGDLNGFDILLGG